jgi:S1-C subfamily serine protease
VEPTDPGDDEQYPPAPVPPHERHWRHPSELGQTAWLHSEPPIAIGRVLLTTTGVIGCLLGVAVLWAMLPDRSGSGVTALSTVVSRVVDSSSAAGVLTRDTVAPSATSAAPTTVVPPTATTTTAPTDPASSSPDTVPGVRIDPQVVTSRPAVAVAIGDQALLITTAAAVSGRTTVTLRFSPNGQVDARVVAVDDVRGLAVLSPVRPATLHGMQVAEALHDGDHVTVLGDEQSSGAVAVVDGVASIAAWASRDLPEGTPVVDDLGRLVGLCSGTADGARLVVPGAPGAIAAWVEQVMGGVAWLGLHVSADATDGVVVEAVLPGGPAQAAGVEDGDAIEAIDDGSVTTLDDLVAALAHHFPGDRVVLAVRRANGDEARLELTVGARSPGL